MIALRTLLAHLILAESNFRVLHWNVKGANFDGVHAVMNEYYSMVAGMIDSVAEINILCGNQPLNYRDSLALVEASPIKSLEIDSAEGFNEEETYTHAKEILGSLLDAYYEVLKDDVVSLDIHSELENQQFILRKEYAYKIEKRLSK